MRYRLRTLMVLLALLPPALGLVYHPLTHAYNDGLRERTEEAEQAELEAILGQILTNTAHRPSVRSNLLRGLLHEHPPSTEGPGLTVVPAPD